jgi:hypothetical protein
MEGEGEGGGRSSSIERGGFFLCILLVELIVDRFGAVASLVVMLRSEVAYIDREVGYGY